MQRHYYRLGIVGNCSYLAYIDDEASVRWLCMPCFDSSFLFGSLLDPHKGARSPSVRCSRSPRASITWRTPTFSRRISRRVMDDSV